MPVLVVGFGLALAAALLIEHGARAFASSFTGDASGVSGGTDTGGVGAILGSGSHVPRAAWNPRGMSIRWWIVRTRVGTRLP